MSSRDRPARTRTNIPSRWPTIVADLLAAYAIFGGFLTLYGWFADIPRLAQWKPDGIPMFPNTAAGVVLGGTALWLAGRSGALARELTRLFAVSMLVLGGLTLSQHLTGIDLGIDKLLADRPWEYSAAAAPMRMGPPASMAFVLLGAAIALLSSTGRDRKVSVVLALTSLFISFLSVTGHLYGAAPMYTLPRLTGVSFQTSTMLFGLAVGVLARVPEREPLQLLLDRGTPGLFARRFLPLVILIPLLLGWARVWMQEEGLVDTAFGAALRTLIEIALLTGLLWRGLSIVRAREEALRRSDSEVRRQSGQLAAFLETAALAMHRVDENGIILWVNDAELALLGYERDEYVGHHITEFHEDKAAISDVLERLKRGEKVFEHPARLRCKDGSTRDVLIDSSVLREEGRFVHTQCFTRDITDRLRDERARALLASIVRLSDDAIVSKTLEGVITSWNQAAERMFGYTAAEAIGSRIDIIIPKERLGEERDIIARLRRGEGIDHFDTIRRRKDGSDLHVSITISPLRDASGNIIGASKIARDISDRKRADAEREEASRRKDEFIAILAHELRNPLAPIRNAAHYLHGMNHPDTGPAVRIIERQVAQMARLIDDLLDVSRISRGMLELRRERIDCTEIVDAAIEACGDELRSRGHTLSTTLPPGRVELDADRERLVQILSNLLSNAAKYTPPGGHIELELVTKGNTLVITVRDDGIGIPKEKLGDIFELFTRVEDPLEKQGGLGIGLTLAQQIAELHGGTIQAHSEGIGCGSEFVVRLPIVATAAERTAGAPVPREGPSTSRRVLVADDNQDVAESLAMLLEFAGHEVFTALDGEAAYRVVAEQQPEVALLDIGMPKANGYEVATRIRQAPWGASVYLVALTGWGQDSDKRRAEEAGFDLHLVKPVDPETIEQILDTLPERRASA